jgi:hypothetical protein
MIRATAIAMAVGLGVTASAVATEIIVPTDMELSLALASAVSGDTITLLPEGSPYRQFPGFQVLNKRLTIRGSTGNAADVVLDGYALDVVLKITGASSAGTVIQDLTIRNGRGATANDSSGAGVVLTTGANTTFKNIVIRDNVLPAAEGNGAGIYSNGCSLRLEDCLIENNQVASSTGDGAGVYVTGGTHTVIRTTFRNNRHISPAANSFAGGLWADNSTWSIVGCTFEANTAWEGGGVCLGGGASADIEGCRFVNNLARLGGGLWVQSTSGGATVRNVLFWGNTSTGDDSAAYAGRVVRFINCTFVGNTAANSYVIAGAANITLDNSIIWGNTGPGAIMVANQVIARHNILQAAYSGATGSRGNVVADPMFKAAADFTLSPNSPAIDAGDTALYIGPFSDLAGADRGVNDPAVPDTGLAITGPVVDMGVYERQVTTGSPCPGDFNNSGQVTVQDVFDFLAAFFAGCP